MVPLTVDATIHVVLTIDGVPTASTPTTQQVTAGIHTVTVPGVAPDNMGNTYNFLAWNDGSTSPSRSIDVESPGVSLFATYTLAPRTCPCGGTYPNCNVCGGPDPLLVYGLLGTGLVIAAGSMIYLSRQKSPRTVSSQSRPKGPR